MQKKVTKKWYARGMEYCLYLMAVLVPAVFYPGFYTVFSEPKLAILRILTLTIIALWGCGVFVEGKVTWVRDRFNLALLAMAVVAVLTTIFSVNIWTSLFGAESRFLGLFTMLNMLVVSCMALYVLNDRTLVVRLLWVSVVTAILMAVYGIFQYFGLLQEGFNWNQDPSERVFGAVGHANHFGAYLGMNLMVGIFLLSRLKGTIQKSIMGVGLIVITTTLFLTASRGALASSLMAFLIVGICLLIKERKTLHISGARLLLGLFIVLSLLVAGTVIFKDEIAKIPVVERTAETWGAMQRGQLPDRLSWWMSAINMGRDKPLLGHGLSTFRDVYNQYRRSDYMTLENAGMQDTITPEAAHNEYLNVLATQGFIGLAVFLLLIGYAFWRMCAYCRKSKSESDYGLVLAVFGALLVYLLQVSVSFGVITTLTMFYLFLGAGMALTQKQKKKNEIVLSKTASYIVAGLSIALFCFGVYGTFREAKAELEYKSALFEGAKGNVTEALNHYDEAIRMKPDFAYYQAEGDYALKTSTQADSVQKEELMQKALESYESAITVNDLHPSTWYNRGVAALQMYALAGHEMYYVQAENYFEESVRRAPNNPLYPYQVAKALMLLSRDDARKKALQYLEDAQKMVPGYSDTEARIVQLNSILTTQETSPSEQ